MKKVVYSISKVNYRDEKLKGIGYLAEGNLLIPSVSAKGNPYIRVFEDVEKKCHASGADEFKGYITVAYTDVPIKNKGNGENIIDYIEVEYIVWFKFVD